MLIDTVSTLALYCAHCGQIQMHDLSRFTLKDAVGRELACSCGQRQATVVGVGHGQYLLDIPCIICETSHIVCLNGKEFWRGKVNKLYCAATNLELGFSGGRTAIEQTVADQRREIDNIIHDAANDDYIENPQIMFEVLNRINDIAERGGVYCRCGGNIIRADVQPGYIELICVKCEARRAISAKAEADLLTVKGLGSIEISSERRSSQGS